MTRKKITGEITHLHDSDGIQTILVEYIVDGRNICHNKIHQFSPSNTQTTNNPIPLLLNPKITQLKKSI